MEVKDKKQIILTKQELFSLVDELAQLNDNEVVVDMNHEMHNGKACLFFTVEKVKDSNEIHS